MSSIQPQLNNLDELIDGAKQLLENQNPEAAYAEIKAVLDIDPLHPKALEVSGFALNQLKNWKDAAHTWSTLFELQPHRPGPMHQTVAAYLASGNFDEGLAFTDKALEIIIEPKPVVVERMRLLSAMGNIEEAGLLATDVRDYAIETRNFGTAIQLARWYSENSYVDEALDLFQTCREFEPSRVDPELYMGRLLYNKKRYTEARKIWEALVTDTRMSGNRYEPYVFLGRIANIEQQHNTAKSYFKEAIREDGRRIEPYQTLINIAFNQRNFDEASDLARQFFEKFPNEGEPRLILAQVAENKHDLDSADAHWNDLFSTFGHTARWDTLYDAYLTRTGRIDKALSFWERREAAGNISENSQYLRATHLTRLDRKPEALKVLLNELTPIQARHESGILLLANTYRDLNQRAKASDAYYAGATIFPSNATFWEGTISFHMDADDKVKVAQLVEEAETKFNPTTAKDCYSVARIYKAAELNDKAEAQFKKLFEIEPEHDQGHRVMMRMLNAQGRTFDAKPHALIIRQNNWRNIEATATLAKIALLEKEGVTLASKSVATPAIFSKISENSTPQNTMPSDRKVVMVTSSLGSGGAERQVAYTAKSCTTGNGIKSLTVLAENLDPTFQRDFFKSEIERTDHAIVDIAETGRDILIRQLASECPQYRDDLALLQSLEPEVSRFAAPFYAWLRLNPTDVVHLWQDSICVAGGMAAVLAGVPKIIIATRSTRPDSRRRLRPYLKPGYLTLMDRPEVTMINNSDSGARDYEDWLGLEKGSVATLHNGMDISTMKRRGSPKAVSAIREDLDLTDENLVLGGVMRFTEEKRPDLFIEVAMNAAKRDPRLRFILVGDGPMREGLMHDVAEAGLADHIIMPGAQNPVEPWMVNFDMLFLSSRMEGLPNVLLEAQCLGTPVASMNVGGAPETLVDGVTGILIDETNPDIIASMILEKLYDREWREAASTAGRKRIKELFSVEAMSQKTRDLYLS